jgi:hypothetical protein
VQKQPDQIKVQYSAPVDKPDKEKDMVGHIVPAQGSHVQYCLTFTLPMFNTNIMDRLHADLRDNNRLLLNLSPKCLQGINIWEQVLEEQMAETLAELPDNADESAIEYGGISSIVVQHYLEEVQSLKYIRDATIRFLLGSNK